MSDTIRCEEVHGKIDDVWVILSRGDEDPDLSGRLSIEFRQRTNSTLGSQIVLDLIDDSTVEQLGLALLRLARKS